METNDPDSLALSLLLSPGAALTVALLAALLTIPLSLFFLMRYRRAVLRSMMEPADARVPTPPDPMAASAVTTAFAPPTVPLPLRYVDAAAARVSPPRGGAAELYRRFQDGPRGAAIVYGIAGVVFGIVANVTYMAVNGLEFLPFRTLTLTALALWPVVLTVPLVWRESGRWWYPVALGVYFGLVAALGRSNFLPLVIGVWTWLWASPTLAILLLANRQIRAVSPLVFVGAIVFVGGAHVALVALYFAMKAASGTAVSADAVYTVVGLVSLAVCALLGWAALRVAAQAYEQRWVGEQTILVDSYFLVFSLWLVLTNVAAIGARSLWLLAPFAAYRAVVAIGMARLRTRLRLLRPLRLLLLRVFGSRSRSERLFEDVGGHWRYAGSIQMIAGTDLATATLEPHEFLDFMGGTLSRRFVKGPGDLSARLARLDTEPDADARFRVNEFFCHDDTWRDVLLRLVAESDAVLMDLRTFSPQRQGCVFELHQLLNLIPLRRILLLADETTDVPFLTRVLEEAWQTLAPESPNQDGAGGTLSIVRLPPGRDSSRVLLALLADAAAGEQSGVPSQDGDVPAGVPASPLVR